MADRKEVVHVFATSKLDSVRVFQDVHDLPIANSNPEELSGEVEPLTDDPMEQATWKAQQIASRFPVLPHQLLSIYAADTAFIIEGKVRHKPGNENGRPESGHAIDSHTSYIEEAQSWYEKPFSAVWKNAIVHHVIGRLNRVARVHIIADFPVGIVPETVAALYNPKLNSRIPVIERAEQMGASVRVSNGPDQPEFPISYALAIQLIRDRVLPSTWFEEMKQSGHPTVITDAQGVRRRLVYLSMREQEIRD